METLLKMNRVYGETSEDLVADLVRTATPAPPSVLVEDDIVIEIDLADETIAPLAQAA